LWELAAHGEREPLTMTVRRSMANRHPNICHTVGIWFVRHGGRRRSGHRPSSLDRHEGRQTIKAIAMSEPWFDHRARGVNADGSVDIGLGGSSDFARRTIRRWYTEGRSDFSLVDEEYFNPWLASRSLAFWFDVVLHEGNGDLGLAPYNGGIGRAMAGAVDAYLAGVERRREVEVSHRLEEKATRHVSMDRPSARDDVGQFGRGEGSRTAVCGSRHRQIALRRRGIERTLRSVTLMNVTATPTHTACRRARWAQLNDQPNHDAGRTRICRW
jgi:hypothetical protein